jgi:hypothetical protein
MDDTIPYVERLRQELVAAISRRGTRRRRVPWLLLAGLAAAVVVTAGTVVAVAGDSLFAPDPEIIKAEGGGEYDPESLRVLRTAETPTGVTFTVVTYRTSRYECVDVVAALEGATHPEGGGGGCGPAREHRDEPLEWSLGGILVGGRSYTYANGWVAPPATTVRVTLVDGRVLVDQPVDGVWIVVVLGEVDVVRIEAFGPSGEVLANAKPPSLTNIRERERELQERLLEEMEAGG